MAQSFDAPEPELTLCINICETADPWASADALEARMAATCQQAGFPHCERLYVGSYFCENYFLGLSDVFHESIRTLAERYDLGATLVVPIFGQAFLERAERRLRDAIVRFSDVYDEIVFNDVACFTDVARWFSETTPPPGWPEPPYHLTGNGAPNIGLGRLFSKELRDARYAELRESTSTPKLSAEAQACLSLQQANWPGVRPLVEIDPLSAIVDVSGIVQGCAAITDAQPEIAIHLPYCYATTGRNCGPASVDEPDSEKFRLGRGCAHHCLRMAQGYLTDEGARYVKHGRTYYFANPTCQIAGAESWRIVYAATHETIREWEYLQ